MSAVQFIEQLRALDGDTLLVGAQLGFYVPSTLNPLHVYADAEFERKLPNPLTSDGAGRFPPFYLDPDVEYRAVLEDADGNEVFDLDPLTIFPGITNTPLDDDGEPMPRCQLEVYLDQTTMLATIYDDDTLTGELDNPVVADIDGELAEVWLDDVRSYRVRLLREDGTLVYDITFPLNFPPIVPPVLAGVFDEESGGVDLTWTAADPGRGEVTEYRLYRTLHGDTFDDPPIYTGSDLEYHDGTVDQDTDYDYRVDAIIASQAYPSNVVEVDVPVTTIETFIAGKSDSSTAAIMTSVDGKNWTLQTTPAALSAFGLTYSPELMRLVAVGGDGPYYSDDGGVTWTAGTNPALRDWTDVDWSPELGLFAMCHGTGGTQGVATSPDGITWTLQTTPDRPWTSLRWSPQAAMWAIGSFGSGTTTPMASSPDGTTWTSRTGLNVNPSFGFSCYKMAVDPASGYFICSSRAEFSVLKSPDGITWTNIATGVGGSACTDVACDGLGHCVQWRIGGDHAFAKSSDDGATWSNTANGDYMEDGCYSAALDIWVCVGNANAPSQHKAMWSTDRQNWSNGDTPLGADSFPSWCCVIRAAVPNIA